MDVRGPQRLWTLSLRSRLFPGLVDGKKNKTWKLGSVRLMPHTQ